MAYNNRLDYALAARSLPGDHPHAIHVKLPTPTRSTLTRKPSFISKLKAKISRKDLRVERYDDDDDADADADAASLDSSLYSQDVDASMDGARGRRCALALCDGDDQLMAEAMKKHEAQKALFRAPSKHAPDSEDISRGPSTHRSTQGTAETSAMEPSPSKPRICTDLASWAQYPSHTRADRCGSAGRVDAMSTIDFGDPSRLRRGEVVTPPPNEAPPPLGSVRRRPTNSSKRSKKMRRGLVKSTSQGLERVGRYYSNLFATAGFRGNNRRTSVSASTGILQHPELEMLAPAAATMDSRQPVYDHLKRVDDDLGMLSSTFRIPSFSKLGRQHDRDKGIANEDDEGNVGPDEEETLTFTTTTTASGPATPSRDSRKKMDWNMSSMPPFRKLSTFFLVESKTHRSKASIESRAADERSVPPEEDEPPSGPVQLDGAVADTDTIDTLDTIEGAERKSG